MQPSNTKTPSVIVNRLQQVFNGPSEEVKRLRVALYLMTREVMERGGVEAVRKVEREIEEVEIEDGFGYMREVAMCVVGLVVGVVMY